MMRLNDPKRRSSLQRYPDLADIGCKLHSHVQALQFDHHSLVIAQMNAAKTAHKRAARADGIIRAGKVANLTNSGGPPFEPADACPGRNSQSRAEHPE